MLRTWWWVEVKVVEGSGFRGSWIGCGKLRCCGLAKSGVYLLPRRGLVPMFDCKSSLCWSLLQTCRCVFEWGERLGVSIATRIPRDRRVGMMARVSR